MFETVSLMARARAVEAEQILEQGAMTFLYRPRVEEHDPAGLEDVQRLLLLLAPEGSPYQRLIVIGRKAVPPSAQRDRFWGFVDLILTDDDMNAALAAQVYGTRTRGLRHLPAARPLATGTYEIETHGSHSHLRWRIEDIAESEPVAYEVQIEPEADYIVTVANPDPMAWGLDEAPNLQAQLFDDLELHVPLPSPFPPSMQKMFRNRRFAQLDAVEWLDHPGAELVFLGSGS
jgi:hypothetical protein